jgi:MFS family permease
MSGILTLLTCSTYGLSKDLGLEKKDYSLASSMTSIATLAWQPFSAYLIVRVNPRILMTVNVFCWGTSAACMAAANGNASLLVTRFLLGLFEAANIPLCEFCGGTHDVLKVKSKGLANMC